MDKFEIRGGKSLRGRCQVSGSKNAALPCLFASLLTDETCILNNVPDLVDIDTAIGVLTYLGKRITRQKSTIKIEAHLPLSSEAPYSMVRRMRASVVVLGPLLARLGKVRVSLPGGCAIGARPVNYHLNGLKKMGAKIKISQGYIIAKGILHGARYRLPYPSVGATENLAMAASLIQETTIIENAVLEPEVICLVNCLKKMGSQIRFSKSRRMTIRGRPKLTGYIHTVIPDRIEAGTYLIAAALTGGRIKLYGAEPEHLKIVTKALQRSGCTIRIKKDEIFCKRTRKIRPVSITTAVYPGFPTDMQAQWMSFMSVAQGKCRITEDVFENRFLHAAELIRMGAQISLKESHADIVGVNSLSGSPVMVSDLRAGAALVLAGLVANGVTTVLRIYHLDRGYEIMEKKLRKLGANIKRISNGSNRR